MIEVFKTNVKHPVHARMLVEHIRQTFGYAANFDLDDCDKILRIKSTTAIQCSSLISILNELGFSAEVLADEIPQRITRDTKPYGRFMRYPQNAIPATMDWIHAG